jgi:ankyrin repeat protein
MPLLVAACLGNVELVKEFLKAGADVSIRNNSGETGHKSVVYFLLHTSPRVWSKLGEVCDWYK